MAKHSEDFATTTWDKNDGSCSVTSISIITPDGNKTADVVTAVTDTPVIQQQDAGLADGGTYTIYVRARVASGIAAGPTVIAAADSVNAPLKIHGPGSNLADNMLLELTASGELILAGGSGNGYRFSELASANNPSGWAGVISAKAPAGQLLSYLLLYSTP